MWHTFIVRYPQFIAALWQHIQLTVIAIIIASLVAIIIAIWCERHRRYAEYFLQITGIFQTLPSLAILGLLIPLVGIGKPTALIALIIYSLLPIFQNTYLGLASVSQGVLDAGRALGLSQSKILKKIQIPLAMPSIVAGIRTATVLVIGTATLASLIGAGGLGDFILLGIDRNNTDLIVIGAIASAVLAILGGLLINLLSRLRGWLKNSILMFLTLFFIGASVLPYIRTDNTSQTITIAGKLGSEPEILINMYADLIKQDQPKTKIVLKPSFGVTSFLYKALESDRIDIYPEFTGTVTESLGKSPVKLSQGANAQITYDAARKLANSQGMTLTKPMKFNDTYAISVTQINAKKYQLANISDLSKLPNSKAGMTAEFLDRADGMPGIEKSYGLKILTVSLDPALRYQAIKQNQVNIIDAYSTDSQLVQYHLKVLNDDRHFFPVYQGAGLMKSTFAKANPKVVKAINKLANKISNTDMQKMNYDVNVNHQNPAKVAKEYLDKQGLTK